MTFLLPEMLFLLVLLPAAVLSYILLLRRRKKLVAQFSDLALVRSAIGTRPSLRRHLPALLFFLGLAAALLAVARPAATVRLPYAYDTVILTLDISRSMAADDVKPNRLAATQAAVRMFIAGQPQHTRIGLVAFASTAAVVQTPTNDASAVLTALDQLQLQNSTAIGTAVLASLGAIFPDRQFDLYRNSRGGRALLGERERAAAEESAPKPVAPGSYKSAVIVLLSDGSATTGVHPIEAARIAADHGVRIFTVGVGTPNGRVTLPNGAEIRVVPDEETLKEMAEITRGEYFYAGSAPDLTQIYSRLSRNLSAEKKNQEVSALFAAAAALLLLGAATMSALSARV